MSLTSLTAKELGKKIKEKEIKLTHNTPKKNHKKKQTKKKKKKKKTQNKKK